MAFVHRFGDALNSHMHYHVVVTDGLFSDDGQGGACFHGSAGLGPEDVATVQRQIRRRGLGWLHRHGHLDDDAAHTLDAWTTTTWCTACASPRSTAGPS